MKLNKYQEKFIKRVLDHAGKMHNEGNKEIAAMLKTIKENNNSLLIEVGRILLDYDIIEERLKLTPGQIKAEFDKLGNLIKYSVKDEIESEISTTGDFLKYVTASTWDNSSYLLSIGIDFRLKKITSKQMASIINKTIKGKNYSDRIWCNKNEIAKTLQMNIKNFLEGKISVNDIKNTINAISNANAFNTKRLIRNEIGRVQADVNEVWAKEHGIEYQLFDATLDNRTSSMCQNYDGKVYRIDDKDKPIPNITTHICCRSCLISIPSKDYRPSTKRDNISKEIIQYKTYSEWKEQNK